MQNNRQNCTVRSWTWSHIGTTSKTSSGTKALDFLRSADGVSRTMAYRGLRAAAKTLILDSRLKQSILDWRLKQSMLKQSIMCIYFSITMYAGLLAGIPDGTAGRSERCAPVRCGFLTRPEHDLVAAAASNPAVFAWPVTGRLRRILNAVSTAAGCPRTAVLLERTSPKIDGGHRLLGDDSACFHMWCSAYTRRQRPVRHSPGEGGHHNTASMPTDLCHGERLLFQSYQSDAEHVILIVRSKLWSE